MNDLPITDLLPELNPAQRKLLADWLDKNIVGEDMSTEPYIKNWNLSLKTLEKLQQQNALKAEIRIRINELIREA